MTGNSLRSTGRKVSFAATCQAALMEIDCNTDITEDRSCMYWGEEGIEEIKQSKKVALKQIEEKYPQEIVALDRVYTKSTVAAMASVNENMFGESVDTSHYARSIHAWCTNSICRGLERKASQRHNSEREQVIEESRRAVVEMSKRGDDDDEIAEVYQSYSQAAVLFALILAKADEFAAATDASTDLCQAVQEAARSKAAEDLPCSERSCGSTTQVRPTPPVRSVSKRALSAINGRFRNIMGKSPSRSSSAVRLTTRPSQRLRQGFTLCA